MNLVFQQLFLKVVGKNPLFLNCLLGRGDGSLDKVLDKCEDKDLYSPDPTKEL